MKSENSEKKSYQKEFLETEWSERPFQEETQKETFGSRILAKLSQINKWLFWVLVAVFLITIAAGGFYFYQYFFSGQDVFLSLKAPGDVLIGVPFDIEVNFQNNSNKALNDVRLSVFLPEQAIFMLSDQVANPVLTYDFDELNVSGIVQKKIPIVVLGNEQSLKKIEVGVSYSPSGLGPKVRLEKTKAVEIAVREPAIKLDLLSPQKILNNEDFEIEIHYQNISEMNFSNLELQVEWPQFYTFKKTSIPAAVNNNVWLIDKLTKDSSRQILSIWGNAISAEGSFFEIRALLEIDIFGKKYIINEKSASLNIAYSPLSLNITINEQADYLASPGNNLKYKLNYRNNSDVGLNDIIIKAQLTGEMFDFSMLRTNGSFDSRTNTITWSVANTPDLRLLPAGASNNVQFEIYTKQDYPIKRISDRNFTLKIKGEISSPTVPYYVASDKTIGLADLESKVAGKIAINTKAFFFDPTSGIVNKGALPPKVNAPINFTIHWIITNYPNDVRDVEIKSFLQSGARWTGQVKANIEALPTYDERTQEVVWLIDKITATKGITSKPIEAIFQIEAVPNITQINRAMPLIGQANIRAFDEFAGVELEDFGKALNTQELADSGFLPSQGMVVQ